MTSTEAINIIFNARTAKDIFSPGEDTIRSTFHKYAKVIHPDVCDDPKGQDAFLLLKDYYEYALAHPNIEDLSSPYSGQKVMLRRALDISSFELGGRYTSDKDVTYILDSGKEKFFDNYLNSVKQMHNQLEYVVDANMKKLYLPLIPQIEHTFKTSPSGYFGSRFGIVIFRNSNEYPFDLFLKAYKNEFTGRDIAWMISKMTDLCCFLRWCGCPMVLNGFTENNLFINPDNHSIHIYGGWWYATSLNEPMIGTSKDVYSVMTNKTKTDKRSAQLTDIECVKAIARHITEANPDIPKPMLDWIRRGSSDNPIEEKMRWDDALERAYGPRSFTKFNYDSSKIFYKRGM